MDEGSAPPSVQPHLLVQCGTSHRCQTFFPFALFYPSSSSSSSSSTSVSQYRTESESGPRWSRSLEELYSFPPPIFTSGGSLPPIDTSQVSRRNRRNATQRNNTTDDGTYSAVASATRLASPVSFNKENLQTHRQRAHRDTQPNKENKLIH